MRQPKLRYCAHPLNDEVIQTYSLIKRDLVEGRESRVAGYFCQRHRRFGRWTTAESVARTALAPLTAAFESKEGR